MATNVIWLFHPLFLDRILDRAFLLKQTGSEDIQIIQDPDFDIK